MANFINEWAKKRFLEKVMLPTSDPWERAYVRDMREQCDAFADVNKELDDALSVLRDLVDLFDNVGIGVRGRQERFDHAWERARALVAEHPTNEETT